LNIFATNKCPVKSAEHLDDKRVSKMILETAQLLSCAVRLAGVDIGYKITHKNHPSAVWTRQTRGNFQWLVEHGRALANEHFKRRGKHHKSAQVIELVAEYASVIPEGELQPHSNNARRADMGIDYTYLDNTYLAYQLYLAVRWENDKRKPTWYGVER
jgi:hypothetical protein